jgi:hypothetical protein
MAHESVQNPCTLVPPPFPRQNAGMATFADHAKEGLYYGMVCTACYRRKLMVSARTMVARGYGDVQVVGCQERFRCSTCGVRGKIVLSIHGLWTGHYGDAPADWAESVEDRMHGRYQGREANL